MNAHYRLSFSKDRRKAWRWRVIARNGQIVATSHQGYSRLSHCRKMAAKLAAWFPKV